MIQVGRRQTDDKGTEVQPNDAWFQLANKCTIKALDEQENHRVQRHVYAHNEVKAALEKLFHDKCAYCERNIESMEVEHFRPAGRVAECKDHPGYYWLAYDWNNLYLSCTPCNQRRRDNPRWGDRVRLPAAGKYDQFPLLDESTRAMIPGADLNREQKLLIDPCTDDPEEYFGYDPFGGIISLKDPVGSKTIEICHLTRRRLKDSRRRVIESVKCVMKVARHISLGNGSSNHCGATADLQALLETVTGSGCIHAGVARYVANRPHEFGM